MTGSAMKTMSHEYQRSENGQKRTHSVVVGEVEENVAEAGEAGVGEEQSPARGKVGIADLAPAQSPEEIDECNDCTGHQRHA